MPNYKCTIRINDEVNCSVNNLHPDHAGYFFEQYGVHTANYYFNPKYQLGTWDGKIRYFHKTGKTYVNLLDEIVPKLIRLGYEIQLDDLRQAPALDLTPIDQNFFADMGVVDEDGEPWKVRDYQIQLVNELLSNGGGVGIAGTGAGKALALDAKVLTPTGWRLNGDLKPGDTVITPKGKDSTILDVFPQPAKQLYRVTFHDGSSVECCGDHLWQVKFPKHLHKAWTEDRIVSTTDIMDFLNHKQSGLHTPGNVSIPLVDPIEYEAEHHLIDPYTLGVLIGDGTLLHNATTITSKDVEILNRVEDSLGFLDVRLLHRTRYDYAIVKTQKQNSFPPSPNLLTERLTQLGLSGKRSYEKNIPSQYKHGTVEQRFELIRGLLDTDGTVDKRGNISFTTVSEQLSKDVQEVIWSLGGTCTITSRTPTYTHKETKQSGRVAYTCFIRHLTPSRLFSLERKRTRARNIHADGRVELTRRVVSIEPTEKKRSQCISIDDSEHLYITDDYIVTHNTSMCAALTLTYERANNCKSIIIVPDKNLSEQTIEAYDFFKVDVGVYGGDHKDLDHQHVVSTWQALKNNPTLIQMFDVIIVDECHGLRGDVLTKLLTEYGCKIPYRYGVTGTLPKAPCDALAVKVAVGTVRYEVPAHVLIDEGYLAKPHIDVVQLEVNLKKEYQEFLDELPEESKKPTYIQFKDSYFPEWSNEKKFLQTEKERLDWIAEYIDLRSSVGKGNTLCLVSGIPVGKKLAKLIPNAVFVHGKDKMSVRREIYDRFKNEDNIVVIASVQIASTGLDIPRIFNMIYIDVGKSFIRTIQSIGRGLRKARDKDKVHITDICSDLKYSKRHLRDRIRYYKEAKYPYAKKKVDYTR